MFKAAIEIPIQEKQKRIPQELKKVFNLPNDVHTFYDLKIRSGVPAYERMFQLVIISLCSDVEFFLKDLFSKRNPEGSHPNGFYQRFDEVIPELKKLGLEFSDIQNDIDNILEAFQIRHICIHNLGFVDKGFKEKISSSLQIGDMYVVTQEIYKKFFDSYCEFLAAIDDQIPDPRLEP